jgi:hypothetical protein
VVTNWNVPIDFLNAAQINKNTKNGKIEKFKAIIFNVFCCSELIDNNSKIPINGISEV